MVDIFFILIAGLLTSCSMPNAVESTVSVDNAEEDIILPDDILRRLNMNILSIIPLILM